jgi:hypothetical protein
MGQANLPPVLDRILDAGADSLLFKKTGVEARRRAWIQHLMKRFVEGCPIRKDGCRHARAEKKLLETYPRRSNVFIIRPYTDDGGIADVQAAIDRTLQRRQLHGLQARNNSLPGIHHVHEHVEALLHCSRRAVAVVADPRRTSITGSVLPNPDVLVEIGVAAALGIDLFVIAPPGFELPHFLRGRTDPPILASDLADLAVLEASLDRWLTQ